ncbi:MAG: STAS domain-containing protein [Burkholderiales bacterium]|nr:STAS domain-containing protein [Burkholderiales bacterium]
MTDVADPVLPRALPAELSIYTATETHAQMLQWLDEVGVEGHAVEGVGAWPLQADAVAQADAAGVQLLVALQHSLLARGRRLVLLQPSAPLQHACGSLGLAGLLNA